MAQSLEDRVRLPPKASGLYQAMLIKSGKLVHYFHPHRLGGKSLPAETSLYSEIQVEQPEIGKTMAHPDYMDRDTELIKPKKLLNPVKASKSHQELHRELLMNHKRGLGLDKKPELQRVLEHRRRNQMIKQKKEEEEAKKRNSPFEQELLKRQQRMNQLEEEPIKEEEHTPEFIKVKENLRRTTTLASKERVTSTKTPGNSPSYLM
ncbi:actin-associated protein FAM107A isoform X2 [Tachyglossus aculeatus]|uniref:actin-associated protein FAM107A isoform X2 n=1 Tax=Tachyglossus aculeatus TaxID=9261 RepID=UPI0018F76989|nr:actin-associated protein FAM107A isoform X2 [Tachyglossus aculeatus]